MSVLLTATSLAWLQLSCHSAPPTGEDGELRENKVRSMATQLLAKFEENSSSAQNRSKVSDSLHSVLYEEDQDERLDARESPKFKYTPVLN